MKPEEDVPQLRRRLFDGLPTDARDKMHVSQLHVCLHAHDPCSGAIQVMSSSFWLQCTACVGRTFLSYHRGCTFAEQRWMIADLQLRHHHPLSVYSALPFCCLHVQTAGCFAAITFFSTVIAERADCDWLSAFFTSLLSRNACRHRVRVGHISLHTLRLLTHRLSVHTFGYQHDQWPPPACTSYRRCCRGCMRSQMMRSFLCGITSGTAASAAVPADL
jgi:hypothetical protein